jgi:hypothetical protein
LYFAYRDKKVVGVFIAFHVPCSPGQYARGMYVCEHIVARMDIDNRVTWDLSKTCKASNVGML